MARIRPAAVGLLLALGVLLPVPPSGAATTISVGGPGYGQWQVGQLWHGPALNDGLVPAGTAIDLNPTDTDRLEVRAVGAGRIVGTCIADRQSSVFVDTVGIGVIGYVHLATGSIRTSGLVAKGQKLGTLATSFVKSACASSWTGPHLHLAFPHRYDVVRIAGQTAARYGYLELPDAPPPRRFVGHPAVRLTLTSVSTRLRVCADNLASNVVTVKLNRRGTRTSPGRAWTVTKLATARCLGFGDLDRGRRTIRGRVYVARAAINGRPVATWPAAGCRSASGGRGMCARALLNKRQ